jgi:murein DD-endopeptidase MepM/ murein hydrolase activator NlpD
MWKKLMRVLGVLSAILLSSVIIVALAFKYMQSPNEKLMNKELAHLQEKYDLLQESLQSQAVELRALQTRDQEIYRVIFEAKPLSEDQQNSLKKVNDESVAKKLSPLSNDALIDHVESNLAQLQQRIKQQAASYDTLAKYIAKRKEMLASIPSIQPISNKQLTRIASGFGARIDPIYKIDKFHAGLDFAAPLGTPVYATGDGNIELAEYNTTGYGNNIWIRHSFGYRTHYAHMLKLKARTGQRVKRGETIGWLGSTGKSTGPHLHYEVEKLGEKIDPIHFFYNDLKPEEFEQIVKLAQAGNQSLD